MWITDLNYVTPRNSEFNFTNYQKNFFREAKGFSRIEWMKNQKGSFGKIFSVPFAEIPTKRGMAFTFNILEFDELMNTQTSVVKNFD